MKVTYYKRDTFHLLKCDFCSACSALNLCHAASIWRAEFTVDGSFVLPHIVRENILYILCMYYVCTHNLKKNPGFIVYGYILFVHKVRGYIVGRVGGCDKVDLQTTLFYPLKSSSFGIVYTYYFSVPVIDGSTSGGKISE